MLPDIFKVFPSFGMNFCESRNSTDRFKGTPLVHLIKLIVRSVLINKWYHCQLLARLTEPKIPALI